MNAHPYDSLTPDVVIDAVESAGYLSDARLLALNSYENRVYQVGIEGAEPLIAKFYRPQRWSEAQILEEHRFSLDLQEAEISVVAPLVDAAGNSCTASRISSSPCSRAAAATPPSWTTTITCWYWAALWGVYTAWAALKTSASARQFQWTGCWCKPREFLLEEFIPRDLIPAYESLTADLMTIGQRHLPRSR